MGLRQDKDGSVVIDEQELEDEPFYVDADGTPQARKLPEAEGDKGSSEA